MFFFFLGGWLMHHTCMVSYIARPEVTTPPGELMYRLIWKPVETRAGQCDSVL